jgi:lysyl-tRNA synthetase class 1
MTAADLTADASRAFGAAKAWPFEEARKVAARVQASGKGSALFETGYGPSGLPHIGTFGEVARTTWVRNAFTRLTGLPSRLVAFSDDMDGLRKVPDNVPNREMLAGHLGKPVTAIPDPFGTHEQLRHQQQRTPPRFLDASASTTTSLPPPNTTAPAASTRADPHAERHEEVRAVILPSLGPDRRATYSPFLPIHPKTGVVMQVPMEEVRPAEDLLVWTDHATGERFGTRITGGIARRSGRPTGRCAGTRSASTTRCRART